MTKPAMKTRIPIPAALSALCLSALVALSDTAAPSPTALGQMSPTSTVYTASQVDAVISNALAEIDIPTADLSDYATTGAVASAVQTASTNFLPLAGGTMTGALLFDSPGSTVLSGDLSGALPFDIMAAGSVPATQATLSGSLWAYGHDYARDEDIERQVAPSNLVCTYREAGSATFSCDWLDASTGEPVGSGGHLFLSAYDYGGGYVEVSLSGGASLPDGYLECSGYASLASRAPGLSGRAATTDELGAVASTASSAYSLASGKASASDISSAISTHDSSPTAHASAIASAVTAATTAAAAYADAAVANWHPRHLMPAAAAVVAWADGTRAAIDLPAAVVPRAAELALLDIPAPPPANPILTQNFEGVTNITLAGTSVIELGTASPEGTDWWQLRGRNWNSSRDLPNKNNSGTVTNASITFASSAFAQYIASPPLTDIGEVRFRAFVRQAKKNPEGPPRVFAFLGSSHDYKAAMTNSVWPNLPGVEAYTPLEIDYAQSNVWVSYSHTFNYIADSSEPKRVFLARPEDDTGFDMLFDDIEVRGIPPVPVPAADILAAPPAAPVVLPDGFRVLWLSRPDWAPLAASGRRLWEQSEYLPARMGDLASLSPTALYIDGQRCAWTNLTVNGVTFHVLAAQPE